ncbi:hypothetical protein ACPF7Z_04445 [Halomonas sp. GXIMD04776]
MPFASFPRCKGRQIVASFAGSDITPMAAFYFCVNSTGGWA